LPPAQPAGQEARLGRPIRKCRIALLSAVSPPPIIQHSALHAGNAGPIYFSDRLRIADVRPSLHFIADDFLSFVLKPACALLPLPARVFGAQLHERSRSLRSGKNLRVLQFCGFQLCA
jgi:hypothetical protein